MKAPPPPAVLAAFELGDAPVSLDGGQGAAWRCGDVVLKPLDMSLEALEWQAWLFESLRFDAVRAPRPRRTRNGLLVADGWVASSRLEGTHEPRWADVIVAGDRFHEALREVPMPDFITRRTDRWSIADRVAWGELPIEDYLQVKNVPRLAAALRPLDLPSRLIHGDLAGNVLFAEGLSPAVIDLAPYWRPVGLAAAVVVADALVWEGADESILEAVEHVDGFPQLFVRALIYRAVTDRLFRADEPIRPDGADPYLPAVDLACRLAS